MKIAIMGGAGTLGSCIAYTLALKGLADELILLDINITSFLLISWTSAQPSLEYKTPKYGQAMTKICIILILSSWWWASLINQIAHVWICCVITYFS